jgi:hypothetical protein
MGQFHAYLIVESLPERLNAQYEMEVLFQKRLPGKVRALPKWKSINIQRNSSCLGKQTGLELFPSTHSTATCHQKRNEKKPAPHNLPRRGRAAAPSGTALAEEGRCLNVSAFCGEAIAEKLVGLQGMEQVK